MSKGVFGCGALEGGASSSAAKADSPQAHAHAAAAAMTISSRRFTSLIDRSPCGQTSYAANIRSKMTSMDVVPPESQATPLRHDEHPGDVPWWTPSWRDTARHLGWRWLLAVPAAVIGLLLLATLFTGYALFPLWLLGAKVVIILLAIPLVLLLEMWRKAIHARSDPFCIHCGYDLLGLPDHHRCPECGRNYSFALIEEYRRDPHWFKQRYKLLGHLPEADEPFHAGKGPTTHDGT